MDNEKILNAIAKLRADSKKRKFSQSVDFSVVLKEFDVKNTANKIEIFLNLPHQTGKQKKVCAFVDKELSTKAKETCDKTIVKDEFAQWAGDKKKIKSLVEECDYFISQGNIMTDVAATFGKTLGPKGKMPNPKSGCIVPPSADLKRVVEKLQTLVKLETKKQPVVSLTVGNESMDDAKLAENIKSVYDAVAKSLPRGEQQIKRKLIKFTMSNPVVI